MFCPNCGKELKDGSKFCPNCGNPVPVRAAAVKEEAKVTPEAAELAQKPVEPQQGAAAAAPTEAEAPKADRPVEQTATEPQEPAQQTATEPQEPVRQTVTEPQEPAQAATTQTVPPVQASTTQTVPPVQASAIQTVSPVQQPTPRPVQPHPAPTVQYAAAQGSVNPSIAGTGHKKHYQKPEDYRNLGVFVLLEFVTFGLYYLYNIVRMTKATNKDDRFGRRSPIAWLILSIFFWPAHWFWFYKTGKILDDMVYKRTGKETSMAVAGLLLAIFQLGFIAMLIFQNRLNKAVGGATGTAPESHGVGTCKQCGEEFPDDAAHCPNCGASYKRPFSHTNIFPFIIMLLGFVAFILIIVAIAAAV